MTKCKQQEQQAAQLAAGKQQAEEELARVRNCYHLAAEKFGSIQQRLKNAQGCLNHTQVLLNDTQARLDNAQGHIEKLRPLAGAGINVLAFARSTSKIGRRLFCSHEMIFGGKCGGVRKAVFLEEVIDHLGKPVARPHLAVVKVVDLSGVVVDNVPGINVLDSASEPLHTALGSISFADFLRANSWAAGGAGATPGPLDGTTMTNFVNTLGLVLLPCDQQLQDELQAYLDLKKPRSLDKMNIHGEYKFAVERDELARQFQLERLQQGGNGSKWCLVMVQPLADQGSLEQHVLKEIGGFHCNPASGGVLDVDQYLYIFRHLLTQLAYSHQHGLIHRDNKPGNILMYGGTPKAGDWDLASSKGSAVWAVEGGLATLDTRKSMWCRANGYVVLEVAVLQEFACTLRDVLEQYPDEKSRTGALFELQGGADLGAIVRTMLDVWTGRCRWSLVGSNSKNELLEGAISMHCRQLPQALASTSADAVIPIIPAVVSVIPTMVYNAMLKVLRPKSNPGERYACFPMLLQAVVEACQERAVALRLGSEAEYLVRQRERVEGYFRVAE